MKQAITHSLLLRKEHSAGDKWAIIVLKKKEEKLRTPRERNGTTMKEVK
jgi:hypothetical protein